MPGPVRVVEIRQHCPRMSEVPGRVIAVTARRIAPQP